MAGIRIVDLSQVIAGPMATAWLADQGADVVKIEDRRGDPSRAIGTRKGDMSALFCAINRGKKSVILDLKSDAGCEALERLIETADVLVQNFRPGVIERLGFGYERLASKYPKLVYCSISGFGTQGPRANARTYDSVVQASSGLAAQQSSTGGPPELVRSYICDKTTAIVAAQAITAALFARERMGRGQHVELNMFDTGVAYLWPEGMQNHTFLDEPPATMPDVAAHYRLWPTRDGHVALAAPKQEEFQALVRAIGRPDLAQDARFNTINERFRNQKSYQAILGEAVAAWTTDELDARMRAEDAAGGRVNQREDLLGDPQAQTNGTMVEIAGSSVGRLRAARHPARFSATPTSPLRPPPAHGAHTDEILAGLREAAPAL
jgi:crotonobetainyl-CoA:carnitine CoA-transferase CaiB-like acyl-CoA transferase